MSTEIARRRVSYEIVRGPIPSELVLDHLCRKPYCVNPWHLEAVPQSVNIARGVGPALTSARRRAVAQCKHGHPFDEPNTAYDKRGGRVCRACKRATTRRLRAQQRSAA